jgi:hypothetical protein
VERPQRGAFWKFHCSVNPAPASVQKFPPARSAACSPPDTRRNRCARCGKFRHPRR